MDQAVIDSFTLNIGKYAYLFPSASVTADSTNADIS